MVQPLPIENAKIGEERTKESMVWLLLIEEEGNLDLAAGQSMKEAGFAVELDPKIAAE